MDWIKRLLAGTMAVTLILLMGSFAGNAHAQGQPGDEDIVEIEVPSANKKLKKNWLKTQDNTLTLTTTLVDAFTPTTVSCPKGGCVLRVEVSSQFWSVDVNTVARMNVKVDNSTVGVEPASLVNVDSTTSGGLANVRTFSWIRKGLSQGNHTVDVEFQVSGGTASAGYRSLKIEVYKGSS